MDHKIVLLILLVPTFFVSTLRAPYLIGSRHDKVIACYLRTVDLYSEPAFNLSVTELSLCTHLIFDIASIMNDTIRVDPLLHIDGNKDERITPELLSTIKTQHPYITITMAVYIMREFVTPMNVLTRAQLVQSAVSRVREFGFDGIDIYIWDYPKTRRGADNLFKFVKDLKEEFTPYDYIVTATFVNLLRLVQSTNELVKLQSFLDYMNIPTSNIVLANYRMERTIIVPLRSKNESDSSSVEFLIKHLLAHGVKPSKLVLFTLMYGQEYLLTDPEVEEIKFEDITSIQFRTYTFYKDVCLELTKYEKSWINRWHEDFSVPYIRDGELIRFYENPKSFVSKVKMIIDYDLRGVALAGVHYDDYEGLCNLPNDTYSEFTERYNKALEDPFLLEKLKDLNLPDASNLDEESYGLLNNTFYFRAPKLNPGPYPLLRTIDDAIVLALEEKTILETLKLKQKSERRHCIFGPQCAVPLHAPKHTT